MFLQKMLKKHWSESPEAGVSEGAQLAATTIITIKATTNCNPIFHFQVVN
jgi:hypothetical protein